MRNEEVYVRRQPYTMQMLPFSGCLQELPRVSRSLPSLKLTAKKHDLFSFRALIVFLTKTRGIIPKFWPKIDGWKTNLSFLDAMFFRCKLAKLVSGRVGFLKIRNSPLEVDQRQLRETPLRTKKTEGSISMKYKNRKNQAAG